MSEILTYHWEGDYLIPDLIPPESPHIGIWGERRRQFLRAVKRPIYTGMLFSGTLNAHLEEIDRTAEEMLDRLLAQMAEREGVTEQVKAEDQMKWVRRMNSIRHRAEEIVRKDLIENSMKEAQKTVIMVNLPCFSFITLVYPSPQRNHHTGIHRFSSVR